MAMQCRVAVARTFSQWPLCMRAVRSISTLQHTAVTSDGQFVQGSSQGSQFTVLAQHFARLHRRHRCRSSLRLGWVERRSITLRRCATFFRAGVAASACPSGRCLSTTGSKPQLAGLIALGWLLMKGWHAQAKRPTVPRSASGRTRGFAIHAGRHISETDRHTPVIVVTVITITGYRRGEIRNAGTNASSFLVSSRLFALRSALIALDGSGICGIPRLPLPFSLKRYSNLLL